MGRHFKLLKENTYHARERNGSTRDNVRFPLTRGATLLTREPTYFELAEQAFLGLTMLRRTNSLVKENMEDIMGIKDSQTMGRRVSLPGLSDQEWKDWIKLTATTQEKSDAWAAEEGRKRSSTLPPLEREPTFQRKPKHFNPYEANNEDAGDSHWKKSYEKVSIEVDTKVKHHLKRQLLHRFEKRLRKMEEGMSDDPGSDRHGKDQHWDAKQGRSKKGALDIFSKYTETGARTIPDKHVQSTIKSDKPLPDIADKSKQTTNGQAGHSGTTHFPEVKLNGDHIDGSYGNTNGIHGNVTSGDEQCDDIPDSGSLENGEFDVSKAKQEFGEEDFRHLDVSPIQTPHAYRPLTREQTRLSFGDRKSRILKGQVHVSCPIRNKMIRVYLSSGFLDSEAERTILMEKVYPELRTLCALHGRDFQMIDPHWGLHDVVIDDHNMTSLCLETLESCTRDQLQPMSVIVLLTNRYGDVVLPSTLHTDEYEKIYSNVRRHTDKEKAIIKSQISTLEANLPAPKERPESGGAKTNGVVNEANRESSEKKDNEPKQRRESKDESGGRSDTTQTRKMSLVGHRKEADVKRDQQQLKAHKETLAALPDPELLEKWYLLDENSTPNVYRLQSISTHIKDFGRGDVTRRQYSRAMWNDISNKLLRMINTYGDHVYNKSLFEMELEHGLPELHGDQCMVIYRYMDDIYDHIEDMSADHFVDVTSSTPPEINRKAQRQLMSIKDELIPQKVSDQYIMPFQASWAPGGVRIGGDRSHQTYLDRMGKHVCDVIKRRLIESFREETHVEETDDHVALFDEVAEHVHFCQERSRTFQGMKETLHVIKSYVRSRCHAPLVVHGRPGCGKSALLAKAAKETHRWLRGTNATVLVRSVGATMASTNIRNLLYGVCTQLCVAYGADVNTVPTDFIGLINDFSQRLTLATDDHPLVLYLDALDRLDEDHSGRKLAWLPKRLPDHVHLVLSTLPDDKIDCMPSLRALLGDNDDVFLEIPELQEADSMVILNHLSNVRNHTMTQEQFDAVFNVLKKCPSPLFLKLLFEESMLWRSYTEVKEAKLPDSVKKMAAIKFGQMEIKFGELLVRRALGYITASKNGVTDQEMVDLLSLDDTVMSDITPHSSLVRRRLPPSLWLRLKRELDVYLTEITADNVKTLQWAHSHFFEAAEDRYLKQRDKAPSYHKAMSEYFMGIWAEKPKPFPGNDKGVLRYVSKQPLYWEPKDTNLDGSDRVYNLRKINELPHHLLHSQQTQLFKSETMCNFEWVLAKLCGTSLRSLVEEYHTALEMEPADHDLKLLSDTLQLSATAVLRDPRQLAGQLVGRLQGIVNRDIPATPGDPPRYPALHAMVAQAKNTSIPALVPSIGCLTEPGGILYDLLSGHTKPITAVTTTTDAQRALTASEDNTMKVWDLKSGKVTSTMYDFGTRVSKLRTALNNKFAISVEGSFIKIWSLVTRQCCLEIDQYLDPPVITIAGEGKLLVAFFDGVNSLRTWDLENDFRHVCESKIEGHSVYSDDSVVLAPNSYGDYVLHAFRGNNCATIQHARNGKVIHKLKCHDQSSSIVALAITRDYMILACRQQYMKLHEIHQLEMFDAKKGKYIRSIRGCTQDIITELHINLIGSHAIAVCASETSNASNIMIWNLETEDHKHLAKHSGVSSVSACADFRYCLTAQKGDNTLKIWNISKYINQPMPKLKKSLGVAEIHPMVDNPRYAIARQVNHGPISIWNVAKAKCLANAVRIERGLSESSDVVLIRNCNVVILTEKGLKDSKPVFKTVLTYDLRQKRYTNRITGCFIVPSPAHEYMLLDDVTLFGPAETRNHFIVWNLSTGREVFRIRPSFKDNDPRGTIRDADLEHSLQLRASTAKLTPWDRRTESDSAKQRRREKAREEEKRQLEELQKEKQNGIEQFIVSGDRNIIVASFFAHHLVVFDIGAKSHKQTLENENSMLFLHVAALNYDGSCLVHANYDEASKISYVTLWDTCTGHVKRRLKNETDVLAMAITDDGNRVVFGRANKELRIWDPNRKSPDSMKRIKGYDSLEFGVDSKIFILNNGQRAVVFAGDISLWDLENATLLAAFTPDTRIEVVNVVMNGQLITMGVHEFPELVVMKMSGKDVKSIVDVEHEDLFGETTGDTSDEDEDDDDDV